MFKQFSPSIPKPSQKCLPLPPPKCPPDLPNMPPQTDQACLKYFQNKTKTYWLKTYKQYTGRRELKNISVKQYFGYRNIFQLVKKSLVNNFQFSLKIVPEMFPKLPKHVPKIFQKFPNMFQKCSKTLPE